tara:strand:- start:2053 stop:2826 length:774 start_codon:yes stop_codon:yes gene_type:complete
MNNTKLDFPTEIIDLPSKGLVYPENHPLRKGNIEIKYMTAREEDILASQTLIKKGVVLDKLFESIVVEEGVNINDVFIGDKNAILMATRVLGYGSDYTVEITDPFTLEKQEVTIDLSKVKTKDVDESLLNGDNRYKFKLPKSGKELVFKLLTHGDETEISKEIQSLERLYKGKGEKTFDVTTRLKYMVQSVDGNEDRGFITNWIQNGFLALDTKAFRKYVKQLSPDMDLKFDFTSDVTGEMEALDIPFGINFFYPSE